MTDAEFDAFVAASCDELERKQADLAEQFGLGSYARWNYDQTTELLTFADASGRVQVEAAAIPIGSFAAQSQTWRWAWANPSVPDAARGKSARLQGLFEATGMEVFRRQSFTADESMAWELAAMAVAHLGAAGCYRAPAGDLWVFLAVVAIKSLGAALS